jgi:Putative zinc-finger
MRPLPREDACTFVRERMELFLDGELTGSENLSFVTHLKECEECAAIWADDEEIATSLLIACGREVAEDRPSFFSADGPRTAGATRPPTEVGRPGLPLAIPRGLLGFGAGAAAALLLAWGAQGLLLSESAVTKPSEPAPIRGTTVAHRDAPGAEGLRSRHAGDERWRRVPRGEALVQGDEIWAAEGPVSLESFIGRAVSLGEDAVATLCSERGESPLLSLHHGRIVADCGPQPLTLRVAEVDVEVMDAACVIEATMRAETLVVLRGTARARLADGRREEIFAGQAVEFSRQGGVLPLPPVDRETELSVAEALRRDLGALREDRDRLRATLDRLEAENLDLRQRLDAWEEAAKTEDDSEPARSITYLVDRYLSIVDQANVASLERPAPIAKETAAQLTECEGDVLGALRLRIATDPVRLHKKALVGLVRLVKHPGSEVLLRELCFDDEARVRESALFCLSRLPKETPQLGAHFLRVARNETEDRLRLRAAVYAARRGEDEGARIMADLYAEGAAALASGARDLGLRAFIPQQMARLEGDLPAADRFLRCLLLDQGSDTQSMAAAIRGLVDRADFEAVEVLRSFSERDDVGADLRRMAREAIRKLEHHY